MCNHSWMKSSRLLSIMLYLQNRGRVPATELAEHLEVSIRTIYRDIDALIASGVPIYADRGPTGGYRLLDGYRTRLTGLTPAEADALLFTGQPSAAAQLGLGAFQAAAELKLFAALPAELRARVERARERIYLDAPGWSTDSSDPPYLQRVAAAVWEQEAITIRYRSWRGEKTHTLDPLGLVCKAGTWYLVATRNDEAAAGTGGPNDEPLTYRVSRINQLTATGRRFDRPAGFDLAGYWRAQTAQFEQYPHRGGEGRIRLSPRGVRLIPMLGEIVMRTIERTASEPDADGWVTATLPIETVSYMTSQLLRFGTDVEVLEPPELRDSMATVATELANRYSSSPSTAVALPRR